jgi:tRNA(Ile)-lysidine synthetase-like protein
MLVTTKTKIPPHARYRRRCSYCRYHSLPQLLLLHAAFSTFLFSDSTVMITTTIRMFGWKEHVSSCYWCCQAFVGLPRQQQQLPLSNILKMGFGQGLAMIKVMPWSLFEYSKKKRIKTSRDYGFQINEFSSGCKYYSHVISRNQRESYNSKRALERHSEKDDNMQYLTESPVLQVSTTNLIDPDYNTDNSSASSSSGNVSSLTKSIQNHVLNLIQQDQEAALTTASLVHLVISVSGGCDSVALLHACMEWKRKAVQVQQQQLAPSITLHVSVVHFHHRQRPIDADQDCQFVLTLVEEYNKNTYQVGLEEERMISTFHVEDWNDFTSKGDDDNDDDASSFSQDKARQWRRNKLVEFAHEKVQKQRQHNASDCVLGIILTAHHQDDSYESALLKLLRGVHLVNWKGMDAITPVSMPLSARQNHNVNDAGYNPERTASPIYLVRPFLHHSKQDLIDYLQHRNLTWKEDTSNMSNKYLRNRVRNELIPLLQDMTNGSFLGKRLPHLLQQSHDIAVDVDGRVTEYLKDKQPNANYDGLWRIDHDDAIGDHDSRLVYSQALHRWMTYQMQARKCSNSNPAIMVPYQAIQRVMDQLQNYHKHKQWELELGNHFSVIRRGDVLRVVSVLPLDPRTSQNDQPKLWSWTFVPNVTTHARDDSERIDVFLPHNMINSDLSFFAMTLEESINGSDGDCKTSLHFVPPWRNSPVKLRQFLRGQNVPMHQRDETLVLFGSLRKERFLVAVQVQNQEWIVNKPYSGKADTNNDNDDVVVPLRLCEVEFGR